MADLLERHKKDKLTFDLPKAKLVILLCNFKALKCQHFKHQNYIVMQVTFHVMKTYYIFQKHPFKKLNYKKAFKDELGIIYFRPFVDDPK